MTNSQLRIFLPGRTDLLFHCNIAAWMDETSNTLFHGGSMQLKNFADTTLLVTLVAASQIPCDWDFQIPTKRENQSIALSHIITRHAFGWSWTKRIVHMDVHSSLIKQDAATGCRLLCEIIDELSNLLLKV